jgi:hypothetical protein
VFGLHVRNGAALDAQPVHFQENNMNRNIFAITAAIAVNFAVATPASAGSVETRAREAAGEGPQALRSFVHRTRMIYALNIQDFARGSADPQGSKATPAGGDLQHADKALAELREQIYRDMLHE